MNSISQLGYQPQLFEKLFNITPIFKFKIQRQIYNQYINISWFDNQTRSLNSLLPLSKFTKSKFIFKFGLRVPILASVVHTTCTLIDDKIQMTLCVCSTSQTWVILPSPTY